MFRCYKISWFKAFLIWVSFLGGAPSSSAFSYDEWLFKVFDQAVLAHGITKSACLVMLGIEAKTHFDYVTRSSEQFLRRMGELSIPPDIQSGKTETWEEIRSEVIALDEYFKPMALAARQVSAGDMHSVAMRILLSRNLQATERFVGLANLFLQDVKGKGLTKSEIILLNQRIISQQLLRDVCLFRASIGDKEALYENMVGNSIKFQDNIEKLITGDAVVHIPKAPNIQIKLRLISVQRKWKKFSQRLYTSLDRGEISTNDMQILSILGDSILSELNAAWERYEALKTEG